MNTLDHKLIRGDCLEVLRTLDDATCLFADPPDNIGLRYNEFDDKRPDDAYVAWVDDCLRLAVRSRLTSPVNSKSGSWHFPSPLPQVSALPGQPTALPSLLRARRSLRRLKQPFQIADLEQPVVVQWVPVDRDLASRFPIAERVLAHTQVLRRLLNPQILVQLGHFRPSGGFPNQTLQRTNPTKLTHG